jgi:hypothetical protein
MEGTRVVLVGTRVSKGGVYLLGYFGEAYRR